MVSQQLIEWVKNKLDTGHSSQQMYNYLIKKGYSQQDAGDTVMNASKSNFISPSPNNSPKVVENNNSKKISKKLLTIVAIVLIVLILVIGIVYIFESYIKKSFDSEYTNMQSSDMDSLEIESTFADYISFSVSGNLDNYFSIIYYGDSILNELNDYEAIMPGVIDNIKLTIQSAVSDLQYSIINISIENDNALITVNATKNGREKSDSYIFLIKVDGEWKVNLFGWNHAPDISAKNISECNLHCESESLWSSGNKYDLTTKECFCWYEPPAVEDLSSLFLTECEQKEDNFKDSCYLSNAKFLKDESYCKLVSSMNRESCYIDLAKLKNDAAVCDNLWDDTVCLNSLN